MRFLPLLFLQVVCFLTQAATITTTGSGNWSSTVPNAPWPSGVIPAATDDIIVGNGFTLTVNSNRSCNSMQIGNGSTLIVGGFNFTVNGATIVGGGTSGQLTLQSAAGTKTFGSVSIGSSATWLNSGNANVTIGGDLSVGTGATFTQGTGRVIFTGASNNTITSSSTLAFGGGITVDKGTSQANVLDVQAVITMSTGGLTLTNGTFKLSSASTITPFSSDPNLQATTQLWCNGGTMLGSNTPVTFSGSIQVTAGTLNIGTSADNYLGAFGSLTVSGGALNVAGPLADDCPTPGATGMFFDMSGGVITVAAANGNTIDLPFSIDSNNGSTFKMTGGTLVIQNFVDLSAFGYSSRGGFWNHVAGSTFTGGTLQIGNASTPAGSTIEIDTDQPIYNLTVNSANVSTNFASLIGVTSATISNDLTISSGTFDAIGFDISVGHNWTNSGSFVPRTGNVTLNGTSLQTISGSTPTSFYNLVLNNTSGSLPGIAVSTAVTTTNRLTMTSGVVDLGGTTFTLGQSGAASTLSRVGSLTTNWVYNGTFKRFWPVGAIASTGANSYGLFPLGSSTAASYRPFEINSTANPTSIGSYSVTHVDNTGKLDLSPAYNDGGTNIVRIYGAQFIGSISGVTGGTYNINATMTDMPNVGNTSDMRLAVFAGGTTASDVGTHAATTGTVVNPTAKRTGVSIAGLSNDFRISTINSTITPLPITLADFHGKIISRGISLEWKTASEVNNDFFTVLHSSIGKDFINIGTVMGNGTSTTEHSYSLIDHDPSLGLNYYRLVQTDFDGKSTSSEIISVLATEIPPSFEIYPNPASATEPLYIELRGARPGEQIHVDMRNLQGLHVNSFTAETDIQGFLKIACPLTNVAPGIYILEISPSANRKLVVTD